MNFIKVFLLPLVIILLIQVVSKGQEETTTINGPATVNVNQQVIFTPSYLTNDVDLASWHAEGGTIITQSYSSVTVMWSEPGTYSVEYDLYTLSGTHYYGYTTITVVSLGPPQPETTPATGITDYYFTANWNGVSGANSYLLDVSANPYFESYVYSYQNRSVSGTSATVTGLAFGTTYYYRVRAVNANGFSQYSNTTSLTTTATLPAVPVATSATSTTSDSFIANWINAAGAVSYRLDVSTAGDFSSFVYGYSNLTVYTTSQLVSGLAAGTTYYYRVRAVNSVGTSASSSPMITATALPQPLPVYVQINGASTAHLFQPVTYTISFYTSSGPVIDQPTLSIASWNVGSGELSHTNYSVTMQWEQPGTYTLEYDFYDNNGGHYYAQLSVVVTSSGPPEPIALGATNPTGNSFTANWQSSTGAASYLLDVIYPNFYNGYFGASVVYVPGYKNRVVTGVAESVTGLQPGTNYYYRLRAVNASGGISTASNIITATTLGPPPAPVVGSASSIMAKSFTANWQPIPGENSSTAYKVDVATDMNFSSMIYQDVQVIGANSTTISNLNGSTTYYYRVRAFNSVGPSAYSSYASVTTPPVPSAPISLTVTNLTTSSFTANWSTVSGATGYQLDVSLHSDFSDYLIGFNNFSLTAATKLISGLPANVTYYFRVRTVNAVGVSPNSVFKTVTTLMAPPLVPVATAPTNVNIGAGSFTANWGGVINATSYQLDVSTNSNFTSLVPGYNGLTVTATNQNVTGLTEKTIYYYRVRAVNSGGASAYSDTIVAMNTDKNYIRSVELQAAGYTTLSQVDTAKATRSITSYAFFDGLGRPVQSVSMQGSPLKKDIVQPVVYDDFGRESIKYLPYVSTENNGWHKENPVGAAGSYTGSLHAAFYQNTTDKIADDTKPYAETQFEASPLSRVVKQGAPGVAWQPNANADQDRSIKKSYETNAANDVLLFTYHSSTGAVSAGQGNTLSYYGAAQLYANRTVDEHNHSVIEYTDKEGRTVCKKVQSGGTLTAPLFASTYYIYDDLGLLRVVLQPELVKDMITGSVAVPTSGQLDNFAFQYKYDGRNRMTEKKVPGAGWVYMIYDKRDRLVMTQDGNQRSNGKNEWIFTKYDALNRPVLTGITDMGSKTPETLRSEVNSITVFSEARGSQVHGYTNVAYPLVADENKYLTVTYYDDHTFTSLLNDNQFGYSAELTGQYKYNNSATAAFPFVKGQVTGTKVRVLESNTFLWTVSYYDDRYRVAQTIAHNNKGGIDRVSNVYDFVGKVKLTQTTHTAIINGTLTTHRIGRRLEYDHAGRLLQTFHKVDDQPEVLLAANEYNELGQLTAKKLFATADPPVWQEGTTYNATNIVATQYNNEKYMIAGNSISLKPGFNVPAGKTFNARVENVWNESNSHPVNAKFAQVVDYRYNIRGWLTRINNSDLNADAGTDPKDYFGMNLQYDQVDAGLDNAAMYNGNISAIKWSSNLGLATLKERGYNYGYDAMNRITGATHKEKSTAWAVPQGSSFSESGYGYDLNGNISGFTRKGAAGTNLDILGYTYSGNQLLKVDDTGDKTKGFIDGVNTGNDYTYDANGNLVSDQNKSLTASNAIQYNHMNLPKLITKGNEQLSYVYDAMGRKLKQVCDSAGIAGKHRETDYAGEFIYEKGILQFANHEEGRVILNNGYEYQYHLKDHLGNVRITFTTKVETDENLATFEEIKKTAEQNRFHTYDKAKRVNIAIFDHTNGASPGYAIRLNGTDKERVSITKSLSVMPGDKIQMEVFAKYVDPAGEDPNNAAWQGILTLLANIANGVPGTVIDGTGYQGNSYSSFPFKNFFDVSAETGEPPKAHLNYIVFDRDYNPIFDLEQTNVVRVTEAAREHGADGPHERLYKEITIKQPGYIYVYLSNDNPIPMDVYFDDFKVTHTKSPVIESTDYYPFGAVSQSYSRENSLPNKHLYQSKEYQDDLDLNLYDFRARQYDPWTVQTTIQDPLAEKFYDLSPYSWAAGNPMRYVDPTGMFIHDYGVDDQGKVTLLNKTDDKFDRLYAVDNKGNKKDVDNNGTTSNDFVKINDQKLLPQLATESKDIDGAKVNVATTSNGADVKNVFKFAADNTDVEWRAVAYKAGENSKFAVGTMHNDEFSPSTKMMGLEDRQLTYSIHSHPSAPANLEKQSMGERYDKPYGDWALYRRLADPKTNKLPYSYRIYMRNSGNVYEMNYNGSRLIGPFNKK